MYVFVNVNVLTTSSLIFIQRYNLQKLITKICSNIIKTIFPTNDELISAEIILVSHAQLSCSQLCRSTRASDLGATPLS